LTNGGNPNTIAALQGKSSNWKDPNEKPG